MNFVFPYLRPCAAAIATAAPLLAGSGNAVAQDVSAALGLESSRVVPIVVEGGIGASATAWVGLGGAPLRVALEPSSVRDEDFQVLVQGDDGAYTEVEPAPATTVRGEIVGLPGSIVAGARTQAGGLEAWIRLPDGAEWWVQPLSTAVPGAPPEQHVLYSASDVLPLGVCGVEQLPNPYPEIDRMPRPEPSGAEGGSLEIAQIACDADYQYYLDWGSVGAVQNRIESVINAMNAQYQNQVGISHTITTILVRTSSSQPYTSTNPTTLLNQFRNQWNAFHGSIQRDVAHLFTGKNLNGGTIGIAWIGVVCYKPYAYGLVESDFTGAFAYVTDLSAHEIGHNWNAPHCSCPSTTMNPYITGANFFHPSQTVPKIVAYRNAVGCLD